MSATVITIDPQFSEARALRIWYLDGPPLSQPLSQSQYQPQSQPWPQSQAPPVSSQPQVAQAPGGRWLLNDVEHAGLGLDPPSSSSDPYTVADSPGVIFTTQATVVWVPELNVSTGSAAKAGAAADAENRGPHPRLVYPACAGERCRKKLVPQEAGGGWWCDACGKAFAEPVWRYVLTLAIADLSGRVRVGGFDDGGTAIFGVEAKELVRLKVGS